MNNEERLLISESIKDDINHEENTTINESMIPILVLFRTGEREGTVSILRSLETSLTTLKFVFSCNCIDSIGIFSRFEAGDKRQFDVAIVEYMNIQSQLNLKGFELSSVKISEIDNEKQTSICEAFFTRDNI